MADEYAGASPVREASPVALIGETVTANATAEASRPWEPTQPQERIDVIDVLRGLALFGIIAANMRGFAGPLYTYFRPEVMWKTHLDFWVQAFVDTFIQGKFIVIFAFLFGVGFALQFSRAEERHGRFVPVYRRRLLALILIGGLHQLLFWWGDVLITYGLGGFLMIWFRKRKNKTVLIWALSLMFAPLAGGVGYLGFRHFRPVPPQRVEANRIKAEKERQKSLEEMRTAVKVYQTGTYAAIYKERLGELWHENRSQPFVVVLTLPVFMLGLLVYRRGIVQNPEAHRTALKKALILGALVGIPANVASTYVMHITDGQMQSGPPGGLELFGFFLFIFGRPALSMCYASAVVLLFLNERWRPRLKPFAVIGRTALSNYLFQTIFCTTIFFGYGGGLFAKVHLAWLMVLSVAVYALEVALSKWWLERYRFGPAEWAWRSLTYDRLQPMKI
jgi:uncharacterized protein